MRLTPAGKAHDDLATGASSKIPRPPGADDAERMTALRARLEAHVQELIELLDALDGDIDREEDDPREDGDPLEPWLGAPEPLERDERIGHWWRDRVEPLPDYDPLDQRRWSAFMGDDREGPDSDEEDADNGVADADGWSEQRGIEPNDGWTEALDQTSPHRFGLRGLISDEREPSLGWTEAMDQTAPGRLGWAGGERSAAALDDYEDDLATSGIGDTDGLAEQQAGAL